jgi:HPt (histidine-containing phosphotransfer) domain-containing protein
MSSQGISGKQSVNIAALTELAEGNTDLLKAIIAAGLKEIPKTLASIRKAVNEGNSKELYSVAHKLCGTTGALAAEPSRKLSKDLADIAQTNDFSHAGLTLTDLEHEIKRVLDALEALRKDLPK